MSLSCDSTLFINDNGPPKPIHKRFEASKVRNARWPKAAEEDGKVDWIIAEACFGVMCKCVSRKYIWPLWRDERSGTAGMWRLDWPRTRV